MQNPRYFIKSLTQFFINVMSYFVNVGSVVEWQEYRNCNRHCVGSKPTCDMLLYPGKDIYSTLLCLVIFARITKFQLYSISIKSSKKFQPHSNILVSLKEGPDCLPMCCASAFPCQSGG